MMLPSLQDIEAAADLIYKIIPQDKRRKYRHWQVTVFYNDGERFALVYTDREKATSFADRQRKSPVVKMARVTEVR